MKSKKYYYTYITTNLINGNQYVGDHSTDNLNDGYLGSGINIVRAIKKYGKENFSKEILELFDSNQKAFDAQKKYINEYNTLRPNGYNISPMGGHQCSGGVSEETKKQISKSVSKNFKNNPDYREKIRKAATGVKQSQETINKRIEKTTGRKHTKEAKIKIGKAHRGRKHSEASRANMRDAHIGQIPWNKGIPMEEETRRKLSEANKGKKQSAKTIAKIKATLAKHYRKD